LKTTLSNVKAILQLLIFILKTSAFRTGVVLLSSHRLPFSLKILDRIRQAILQLLDFIPQADELLGLFRGRVGFNRGDPFAKSLKPSSSI
jgi:hypothetical protein